MAKEDSSVSGGLLVILGIIVALGAIVAYDRFSDSGTGTTDVNIRAELPNPGNTSTAPGNQ